MKLSQISKELPTLDIRCTDQDIVGISSSFNPLANTIVYVPAKAIATFDFDANPGVALVDSQSNIPQNAKVIVTSTPRLHLAMLTKLFKEEEPEISSFLYYVHPLAKIGKNVRIHPFVFIGPKVTIGDNCIIYSGTSIGSDGFGYEKAEDGNWIKMEHLGGVRIGNNVEIGANTCIDRGTLDDTIIEDNVKIDNLVHIAHNVHIKENSMIIANAMVAGSVKIERNCWIAPSSSIREGLTVGSNSLVGLGSVVTKSIPPDTVVMGNPARPKEQ